MAELTGPSFPDPERVHALLVGIEDYPRMPGGALPGAAADAMRLARWLRRRGVPGGNIRLLLAPMKDSWPALNTEARELGVAIEPVISRDQILDKLAPSVRSVQSAPSAPSRSVPEGDVLYVYWGGHGELDRGDRRLLLCPDASDADRRYLDLMDLRDYLTRPDVASCRRQVFLVDACATFVPAGRTRRDVAVLPTGNRVPVEQFMLLAAASGQAATHRGAARTGAFSTAVMDWLEEHSPDLGTDLDALVAHVKEHFAGHRLGSRQLQTPVTLVIQPVGGDVEIWQRSAGATPPDRAPSAPSAPAAKPSRRGGGGRAAAWAAGGGALALVAMVAIVAMFLSRGDDPDRPDQPGPSGAPAVAAVASASGPATPSPSPSASPSPVPSVPTGATSASQKPAVSPSASVPGQSCGAEHTTSVADVLETVCYVRTGGRITMVAIVRATVPKDVTVNLWLAGPNRSYVFPAGGPKAWTIRAGSASQRFEMDVTATLKAKSDYEVHISTLTEGTSAQYATTDPSRGHSMPFTY
ncbi:hypothetical protein GCM10010302_46100 [Streptomyces polychromogenes]|uniref:Peptidase C14 caspase domain-containing protein n=1 Tax=Streptomyces polychromogenes TaxID=67342 RepID=A0ABP3F7B6_9ACTN